MIKFIKGKDSKYVYDGFYGYNLPSVTKMVFGYIKHGELAYISNQNSIIFRLLQRLGLR